jgi:hypothetical protein
VRGGVCGVLMEHFSANLKVIERQNLFLRSPRPSFSEVVTSA